MSRTNAATGESQYLVTHDVTLQTFLFYTTDVRHGVRRIPYFKIIFSALISVGIAILLIVISSLMINDVPVNFKYLCLCIFVFQVIHLTKIINRIDMQNEHQSDFNQLLLIKLVVLFVLFLFIQANYVLNQSTYIPNIKNVIHWYAANLFISIVCVFYHCVIRYFQIDPIIVNVAVVIYPMFMSLINAFMIIVNTYYANLQRNIIALDQDVNLRLYPIYHFHVRQMIVLSVTVIFEPRYRSYEIYEIYDDIFVPETIQWPFNHPLLQMYSQGYLSIQLYFIIVDGPLISVENIQPDQFNRMLYSV